MDITNAVNTFNDLTAEVVPKLYLPRMYNIAFERKRAEMVQRVPRSSAGVENLKVNITYETELPWGWRHMSAQGYTPTGGKFDWKEAYAQLSCHASAAMVTLEALEMTEQGRWVNILRHQMDALMQTFPYYLRGLLWSSQNSYKALAQVASIDGLTVTLDNAGLWHTATADRCKLVERGMYLQALRSGVKLGDPFKVTSVNKAAGTLTISADPGLADNDVLTFSDVAGLDQPYTTLFPGILDVIDNDNTFQGVDRSSAANADYRAVVTDATGETLDHELLTDFFHKCYDPEEAFTNWKVVRAYWANNLASKVNYTPGGNFVDGVDGVQVGRTRLLADADIDEDKIIVPDFANMRIADRGQVENLFGKGWQQIAGRPFIEYVVVWWGLLLAEDTRYMGLLDNISLAAPE